MAFNPSALLPCCRAAGATQAATCLALLACCRAVEGAAAALAGPAGSQAMAALLCNHHRMLQQVRDVAGATRPQEAAAVGRWL